VIADAGVPLFTVEVAERGPWVVARLSGELDYVSCPELRARLAAVLDGAPAPRLAVDVSGLKFCDSAGLGCFVWANRQARERGGELVLAGVGAPLGRVLTVTGLDQVLRVADVLSADAGGQK
jgi:anti-sigma B factor antagonist